MPPSFIIGQRLLSVNTTCAPFGRPLDRAQGRLRLLQDAPFDTACGLLRVRAFEQDQRARSRWDRRQEG